MLSQSLIASYVSSCQALAAFGHDAEGCDVLRATADCFGSTNVASSVDGEAGKFLREVYTQLGLVTEKLHGTAAAHSVYELAVARGVWLHPLQRPQDVFQTPAARPRFWDAASLPCARALEAHYDTIRAECKQLLASQYTYYRDKGGGGHGGAHARLVTNGEWSDVQLYAGCRKEEKH